MPHTKAQGVLVRSAQPQDIPLLLTLIAELASYEKRPEAMTASAEDLHFWIFEKKTVQVLLAEYQGKAAGYALFYPIFSSFKAKASLYLEDIFILPQLRGRGLGKYLFSLVAQQAVQQNMQSLKWSCLAWNRPSIDFYLALESESEEGVCHFSLGGGALCNLAAIANMSESIPARDIRHAPLSHM